jgi:aarF domain-containing kinase
MLFYVEMLLQDSPEWDAQAGPVHQRAADRILAGCLKNGGLYIKLGQGLVSFNHLLPKEYLDTLQVLYDKAPARKKNEVSLMLV